MIHKVNTGWLRAVVGVTIGDTFADAWSSIVNALEGAWGNIRTVVITGATPETTEYIDFLVIKGEYKGTLDTTSVGEVEILLPYKSVGISKVQVEEVVGELVTTSTTYVVSNNESISITLTGDRKLITVSGTARRI
jgi:hypothetical protein